MSDTNLQNEFPEVTVGPLDQSPF